MSDVTQRVVTKALAGVQDIVTGIGEVTQNRAGNSLSITKLNASELQGALVVNTIEELTSLVINKLGETKTVIVKDKDRGGIFSYDINNANTNNGGTIFNGWTRQYDGAVNVKWFGAKGDGVTDDTEAIQNAINTGSNVFIDNSVYLFTYLYIDKSISIFLNGTMLQDNSSQRRPQILVTSDNVSITGGGTFDANGTRGDILEIRSSNNTIDNIKFKNISCDPGTGSGDFAGILLTTSSSKSTINSCTFKDLVNDGADNDSHPRGITSLGNTIQTKNCYFSNVNCCHYVGGSGFTSINAYMIGGSDNGFYLGGSGIRLVNPIIIDNEDEPIVFAGATNCTVNGGVIRKFSNAISFQNANNVTINGTVFEAPEGSTTSNLFKNRTNTIDSKNISILNIYAKGSFINDVFEFRTGKLSNFTLQNSYIEVVFANEYSANDNFIRIEDCNKFHIINNTFIFSDADGYTAPSGDVILSIGGSIERCTYSNNILTTYSAKNFRGSIPWGLVNMSSDMSYQRNIGAIRNEAGARNVIWSSGDPTSGTWTHGDIVYNQSPSSGSNIGWVCTEAGTPGTWKSFGTIES